MEMRASFAKRAVSYYADASLQKLVATRVLREFRDVVASAPPTLPETLINGANCPKIGRADDIWLDLGSGPGMVYDVAGSLGLLCPSKAFNGASSEAILGASMGLPELFVATDSARSMLELHKGVGEIATLDTSLQALLDEANPPAKSTIPSEHAKSDLAPPSTPHKTASLAKSASPLRLLLDFNTISSPLLAHTITALSCLQWSEDLGATLRWLEFERYFVASIFTSNSLSALHAHLGSKSPLLPRAKIEALLRDMAQARGARLATLGIMRPSIYVARDSKSPSLRLARYLANMGLLGGGGLGFRQKRRLLDLPLCMGFEVVYCIMVK